MDQFPWPNGEKGLEPARHANKRRLRVAMAQSRGGINTIVEEDHPADYWGFLWRSRSLILSMAAVGLAAGFLIAMLQTPIYQARTSLELQMRNEDFLNMKGLEPTAVNYDSESYVETQIEVLQSEAVAKRTEEHLIRQGAPAQYIAPRPATTWFDHFRLVQPKPESRNRAISYIVRNMSVKGSGLTRIVQIVCQSPHPDLAVEFANALAAEFVEQDLEAHQGSAQRSGDWLNQKLQDLKTKLEASEKALQDYSSKYGLLFTSEESNIEEETTRRVETELSAAENDLIQKRSRYEQALKAEPESLPEVLDSPELRDYQTKLSDLRRQLAETATTMTPEHPKTRKLQAQIAELNTALLKYRSNIITGIRNEYETADRRERMLKAAVAQQRGVVADQAAKSIRYNLLKREVDSTRQLYDSVLQKLKETSVAGAMPVSSVRIVDRATPPTTPALPSLPLNCACGLIGGVAVGLGLGILRNRSSRWVQVPGEINLLLSMPELGSIPSAKYDRPSPLARLMFTSSPRPNTQRQLSDGTTKQPVHRHELAVLTDNFSIVGEAYRAVLASILFATDQGRLRTLVVTSPSAGEGKTSSACNLAAGLGELGKRVLLIDADLRRPSLHGVFGIPRSPGLSEFLLTNPVRDMPRFVVTQIPGVSVIPAGAWSKQATNQLFSTTMTKLISAARDMFDIVLIDTAPLLALRDARLLGKLVDGVVLVVRAGRTSKVAASAAASILRDDGTVVIGAILNDWNPKSNQLTFGGEYLHGSYRYRQG